MSSYDMIENFKKTSTFIQLYNKLNKYGIVLNDIFRTDTKLFVNIEGSAITDNIVLYAPETIHDEWVIRIEDTFDYKQIIKLNKLLSNYLPILKDLNDFDYSKIININSD